MTLPGVRLLPLTLLQRVNALDIQFFEINRKLAVLLGILIRSGIVIITNVRVCTLPYSHSLLITVTDFVFISVVNNKYDSCLLKLD